MIGANMSVFMWVWALALYPVYHWGLTSAQRLPLAHQAWSRKEAPSAAFPPLSCYTAGDAGAIYSPDWLRSTQLCSPSHCSCGHLWWKCSFWRGFELVSVICQKNGLTTELLTEKRGRRRSRGGSLISLFAFCDSI